MSLRYPADMTCLPWFHAVYAPLESEPWTKATIPSGCSMDGTGNIPCEPEAMRAASEAWLAHSAPQALAMIGGSLSLLAYTFARYMHSEVGSGTIEERVAVGEAAVNQAKRRAGMLSSWHAKLNGMLLPNGMYGAIHAPDAYCASIGMGPDCNAARRWAATSRDPSVMALLLAHLVVTEASDGFALGAETQWGPEYLKNPDGSRMKSGTTQARVESFVRYAASDNGGRYYWVGDLPGVDPWHTWLAAKGSSAGSIGSEALIQRGISALPLTSGGTPIRPDWGSLPVCSRSPFAGSRGEIILMAVAGLAGVAGAVMFDRWLSPGKPV
jgi:hypothetical protein